MVFFNDTTNQTVSQNIEKYTNSDTKNIFKRNYTNRSKQKLNLKLLTETHKMVLLYDRKR